MTRRKAFEKLVAAGYAARDVKVTEIDHRETSQSGDRDFTIVAVQVWEPKGQVVTEHAATLDQAVARILDMKK
jgi:hypothetical protein